MSTQLTLDWTGHRADLPANLLELRALVNERGETPVGSCGWGHYCMMRDGVLHVADGGTIGRLWPARFDRTGNRWIITGDGYQFRNGQVIEIFPCLTERP